jgi:hypothetical protein
MREPSIHITETRLLAILDEYENEHDLGITSSSLAKFLLKRGSNFNLSHRIILANNKKNKKKAFSLKASPTEDSHLFANTLYLVRKSMHYRGNKQHKESSKEWTGIKEAAGLAVEFCKSFELNKKSGFESFIRENIKAGGGKFDLRRISARYELVCDRYYAIGQIANDINPDITEEIYDMYQQKILEKCGNNFNYKDEPQKYLHFIDASAIAKSLGLTGYQYVEAHFDSVSWTNGVPHVSQLSAQSSIERILRWMIENGIQKSGSNTDISGDDLKNILKYGSNNSNS